MRVCVYNGKPMINSVNGKQSSMEEIFPLVKKYGGVVVALTLDESASPIRREAAAWRLPKKSTKRRSATVLTGAISW